MTDLISKPLNFFGKVGEATTIPEQALYGLVTGSKVDDLKADQHTQLSQILSDAGWGSPTSTLNMQARAVVKRESSGNPNAQNPSGAIGLFQIGTTPGTGSHCGSNGLPTNGSDCVTALKDPLTNAKVAKALYDDSGWSPWAASGGTPQPTTWDTSITTKESATTLGAAGDAVSSVVPDPIKDVANAGADLVKALFDPSTYLRLGKGALGASLIGVGLIALIMISVKPVVGSSVGRAAKRAAEVAAA